MDLKMHLIVVCIASITDGGEIHPPDPRQDPQPVPHGSVRAVRDGPAGGEYEVQGRGKQVRE